MEPFRVQYTLTRRQRVGELFPWLPALAGSLGFSVGVAYLALAVSAWFLALLLLPLVFYRGLFSLLLELVFSPSKSVEVIVDADTLTVVSGRERRELPLAGIIQVYRDGSDWVVLHVDRTTLLIPMAAVTEEQVAFLKSFALLAARARR